MNPTKNKPPKRKTTLPSFVNKVETEKELLLEPGNKRVFSFLLFLFIALIFSAFSVFMMKHAISNGLSKNIMLTIFGGIFSLVSIFLLGNAIHQFIAIFNPKPRAMLSPGYFELGKPTDIAWKINKGGHRIRKFTILLIGEEHATYRRGTDTVRQQSIFYQRELVSTEKLRNVSQGTEQIVVENDGSVMPTWEVPNNAIKWRIEIKGDIKNFPDILDTYDVIVLPEGLKSFP